MDDQRVADYFIVAGLENNATPLQVTNETEATAREIKDPITDLTVINRSAGETVPEGYICIEQTPGGNVADLNFGSFRCPQMHLCYRRGRDKPPLVHIGVLYEGRDRILAGCEIVRETPEGRCANVNNANTNRTFIYLKRASPRASPNDLVVTDVCVVIKDEKPPHTFWKIGDRNLNNALLGADVFLCFKKATCNNNYLTYQPSCLFRYPKEDYPSLPPLPADVPLFALPMGASLEAWPIGCDSPRTIFAKFVLTVSGEQKLENGNGKSVQKLYGSAITFYEPYDRDKLNHTQLEQLLRGMKQKEVEHVSFFASKAICILSRWPFFDACQQFLQHLLSLSSLRSPQSVPIERVIAHLIRQVPFPSIHRPKVLIQVVGSDVPIPLTRPDDSPIPLNGSSFSTMLKNLSAENCANILLMSLLEQKICLHSLRPDVLTSVAECVTSMIFPFVWQCPYVPLCPLGLCGLLHAPVPFIVGVDSRYFDLYVPPSDVIYVDLDTNSIDMPPDAQDLNLKILPKKSMKILIDKLEKITVKMLKEVTKSASDKKKTPKATDVGSSLGEKEFKQRLKIRQFDAEIQEAFLFLMVSTLKGYRMFLKPMTGVSGSTVPGATDPGSLFDIHGFLKSRDRSYSKFFQAFTRTQQFIRFIEERSIMSDREASYGMAFFDGCVDKFEKEKIDEIHLIDVEGILGDRTVFIPPPEPDKNGHKFTYGTGFPALKYELFEEAEGPREAEDSDSIQLEMNPIKNPVLGDIVTTRTKHEIRTAQTSAQNSHQQATLWAKFLVSTGYAIWFMHLPSLVNSSGSPSRTLRNAFDILKRMLTARIQPSDEVCYRVMMKLCGQHSQPALAVKVLCEMKNHHIQPDAVTYGYYNKSVFESEMQRSPDILWTRLRHVIRGATFFAEAGRERRQKLHSKGDQLDAIQNGPLLTVLEDGQKRHTAGSSDTGFFSLESEEKRNSNLSLTSGEFLNSVTESQKSEEPKKSEALKSHVHIGSIVRKALGSGDKSRLNSVDADITLTEEEIIMNNSSVVSEDVFPATADVGQLSQQRDCSNNKPRPARRHRSLTLSGQRPEMKSSLGRRHFSTSSLSSPHRVSLRFNPFAKSDLPKKQTPEILEPKSQIVNGHISTTLVVAGTLEVLKESIQHVELPPYNPQEEDNEILEESITPPRTQKSHSLSQGSAILEKGKLLSSASTEFGSNALKLGAFIRNTKSYSSIRKFWNSGEKKKPKDVDYVSLGSSTFSLDEASPLARSGAVLYSGMKSVTSALGKKLDEISTSLTTASSNSPSPSRIGSSLRDEIGGLNFDYSLDEFEDRGGSFDENSRTDAVDNSSQQTWSFPSYVHSPRHTCRFDVAGTFSGSLAIHVDMITLVLCSRCRAEVYDEEIMAGWWPDESNLNARCPYCATKFLPELSVMLYEHFNIENEVDVQKQLTIPNCPYLVSSSISSKAPSVLTVEKSRPVSMSSSQDNFGFHEPGNEACDTAMVPTMADPHGDVDEDCTVVPSISAEDCLSQASVNSGRVHFCRVKEVIKVPYLSPLVLRKEMESLIANEGELCFADPNIVKSHDIVYWNLMWYCERLNLPHHLSGLLLADQSTGMRAEPLQEKVYITSLAAKSRAVSIDCRWDDPCINSELGAPMYISFGSDEVLSDGFRTVITRNLMEQMLARIRDSSDLLTPMKTFLHEVSKMPHSQHRSLYRELLFLAVRALDSENIDKTAFDKVFKIAFNSLRKDEEMIPILQANDKPLSPTAGWCRHAFRPLEL